MHGAGVGGGLELLRPVLDENCCNVWTLINAKDEEEETEELRVKVAAALADYVEGKPADQDEVLETAAGTGREGVRVLLKNRVCFDDAETDSPVRIEPGHEPGTVLVQGVSVSSLRLTDTDLTSPDLPSVRHTLPGPPDLPVLATSLRRLCTDAKVHFATPAPPAPRRLLQQKDYIRRHKVHLLLGSALDACLKELPPDPYFFIAAALLRQRTTGGEQREKVDDVRVLPRESWASESGCKVAALELEIKKLRQQLEQSKVEASLEREVSRLREKLLVTTHGTTPSLSPSCLPVPRPPSAPL